MRMRARYSNKNMKLFFPGSFDPFTSGHANLVVRALKFADSVVIAVGVNESKRCMFTADVRVDAISRHYASEGRVSVIRYEGLTVDAFRASGADAILRGVRSMSDFENECVMADANRALGGVETILLPSDPSLQFISSSLVRELINFGRPVDGMMLETFNITHSE